jgi:hypothetical protein
LPIAIDSATVCGFVGVTRRPPSANASATGEQPSAWPP